MTVIDVELDAILRGEEMPPPELLPSECEWEDTCTHGPDVWRWSTARRRWSAACYQHSTYGIIAAARTRDLLRTAPDLLAFIHTQIVPGGGNPDAPRVSASKEPPLPLNAAAVDDERDIYVKLATWATNHAATLNLRVPASLTPYVEADTDPVGLPKWAKGPDMVRSATLDVTAWLLVHDQSIRTLPIVAEYDADLQHGQPRQDAGADGLTPTMTRWKVTEPPKRAARRLCPACGRRAFGIRFGANLLDTIAKCDICGHKVTDDAMLPILEALHAP